MTASPAATRALAALALMALAATACENDATAPVAPGVEASRVGMRRHDFKIYTQNMYLGGDTGPLFTLDFTDIGAVLAATGKFWNDVQASNIPARAAKFVDQIDAARPDVVSFQEALRFVVLDGSFHPIGGADLLASVQAEITRRGMPYQVALVQEETSSTLPLAFDPHTGGISQWLNFTDRDVIIRRNDVKVLDSAHAQFNARLSLGPVTLVRGWARLTIDRDGTPYQFITTHLETPPATSVQDAQAIELQAVLAGLDGVTILAGDLNSNAAAKQGTPTWTATYGNLLNAGFTDVWIASNQPRGATGVTCCQDPSLKGPSQLDQRIDFVLVRDGSAGRRVLGRMHGLFDEEIVGARPSDRTAGGLWPSDHAGVIGSIDVPPWLLARN